MLAFCLPTPCRLQHESITLNEEKKALATIKKLQQQRERVGGAGVSHPSGVGWGCQPTPRLSTA